MLSVWLLKRLKWIKPLLSLKHGNGPTPSKPSRGLYEHLREAYEGFD